MDNEIMVSVRCTCYNHEKYLRQALDGIVMQKTNFKFEVIIHDDASTDHSQDIIREYERKYPDIIRPIYQSENQHSRGIDILNQYIFPMVRGKYIAICECDDYWADPFKLQKQIDFLEAHEEYSACCHAYCCVNENNDLIRDVVRSGDNGDISIHDIIMNYKLPQLATIVHRTNMIADKPDFFSRCKVGDYPLLLYLGTVGKVYYFCDQMSAYRIHEKGSWVDNAQRDPAFFKEHVELLKEMLCKYDAYSNYQHTDLVHLRMSNCDFILYKLTWNLSKILNNDYYKTLPIIARIKTCLHCLLKMKPRR